jgi:hypothetical protein
MAFLKNKASNLRKGRFLVKQKGQSQAPILLKFARFGMEKPDWEF